MSELIHAAEAVQQRGVFHVYSTLSWQMLLLEPTAHEYSFIFPLSILVESQDLETSSQEYFSLALVFSAHAAQVEGTNFIKFGSSENSLRVAQTILKSEFCRSW